MSGPHAEQPIEITEADRVMYLGLMNDHGNIDGQCPICHMSRCPTYAHARAILTLAGALYEETTDTTVPQAATSQPGDES